MAKFYGVIGYGVTEEQSPGVWGETITERSYYGDIHRNIRKLQSSDKVNDDINISVEISIVADPFAYQNFHTIKYVEYMGAKWKVDSVDIQHPRLVLSLGGLYNVE